MERIFVFLLCISLGVSSSLAQFPPSFPELPHTALYVWSQREEKGRRKEAEGRVSEERGKFFSFHALLSHILNPSNRRPANNRKTLL